MVKVVDLSCLSDKGGEVEERGNGDESSGRKKEKGSEEGDRGGEDVQGHTKDVGSMNDGGVPPTRDHAGGGLVRFQFD